MTAPDVRTAAQTEAERIWPLQADYTEHQQKAVFSVKEVDAYNANAFQRGAVWGAAYVTPTREQIAGVMKHHHFSANRLDNITWGKWMAECECGWESEEFDYPGDSVDAFYTHASDAVLELIKNPTTR